MNMPLNLFSRRELLRRCGNGIGLLAMTSLLQEQGLLRAAPQPLAPKTPHIPGRAKSVIWLFMNGGPSQVDTWDYKPELIVSGSKRHFEELKVQLIAVGYEIVPVGTHPYCAQSKLAAG